MAQPQCQAAREGAARVGDEQKLWAGVHSPTPRAPAGSHLSGNAVEVLPQHPPHVLPGVGRHLVLQEEGELAAFPDAVEVAVDLVVLAAWGDGKADADLIL